MTRIDVQQVELSTHCKRACWPARHLEYVDYTHMPLTYIMFMYVYTFSYCANA